MLHMLDTDTESYIIKRRSPAIGAKLTASAFLVTNNERHYERIPGLVLANWSEE